VRNQPVQSSLFAPLRSPARKRLRSTSSPLLAFAHCLSAMALLCLLAASPPTQGQSGSSPKPVPTRSASDAASSGLYRIAGIVVNSVTGEPVRRASVAVLSQGESQVVQSVFSGDDGRFVVDELPAAKYQLTASKRGFRTVFFKQHEDYNSAIVTGVDQDTSHLTFQLPPDAVIHGAITADGGDPVEAAQVLLFRKPAKFNSLERITQAGTTTSDDAGAFEFSDLAPGEYLLAVKATPWYAVHPSSSQSRNDANQAAASASSSGLDVAFPITFFDATTEEASATSILVAAGSREEANLSLHAVPALHLTVHLPTEPAAGGNRGRGSSVAQIPRTALHQSVFGTEIAVDEASFINFPEGSRQAGTEEFDGVAPGHYELEQGNPPHTMELNANSSQQIDTSTAIPSLQVAAVVRSNMGNLLPDLQALTLESLDADHRFVPMQVRSHPNGPFTADVPPGNWKIWLVSESSSWTVLSITADGRNQPGNQFTVRDRALSLTVSVAQSATRIEGFARKDDKGIPGAMVVLVPRGPNADKGLLRRDQSDSDGSFALLDAAPGDYLIVAIENGWDIDWARPEVMARYLSLGIPVTIKGTSGKLIRLSQPVPVQSAPTTP